MQKNIFKKTITLIYLTTIIFSLFFPFNQSFAEGTLTTSLLKPTSVTLNGKGLGLFAPITFRIDITDPTNTPEYSKLQSATSDGYGNASSSFSGLNPGGKYIGMAIEGNYVDAYVNFTTPTSTPNPPNPFTISVNKSNIKISETTKIVVNLNAPSLTGGETVSFTGGNSNLSPGVCTLPPPPQIQSCSVNFSSLREGTFPLSASVIVNSQSYQTESLSIVVKDCLDPNQIVSTSGICITPNTLVPGDETTASGTTDTTYSPLAPLPGFPGEFDTLPSDTNQCPFGNYLNIMIKLVIGVAAVLAMVMIVMGGIEYMTSDLISSKEAGKDTIKNALLGLLIALGAYLILNTINPKLLSACLDDLPVATITIVEELPDGSYSSTGGAGTGSGGSCKIVTDPNNACSVTKLASSCFGGRVEEASKICNVESGGGRTDVKSGSDLLNNGSGPSYSVGLWQINLTVHQVGGLNCPAAFSGPCGKGTATPSNEGPFVGGPKVGNCSQKVINQSLYDQCVSAAQDPVKNTTVACTLYTEIGNSFKPWAYTAKKCSIPKK